MKWKTKTLPPAGATRVRRAFLWLPFSLQGQTRWLERATWIETNVSNCAPFQTVWFPTRWMDAPRLIHSLTH